MRLTPSFWHLMYLEEAVGSFINDFFISSIVASSALVECSLFLEFIRVNKKYQKAGTVLPSNISLGVLFDYFKASKVPLECLLDNLEELEKPSEIKYVQIRNKFTHGDMWRAVSNPSLYLPISDEAQQYGINIEEYLSPEGGKWVFENISYIQLNKSLRFMNQFV